MVAPDFSSREKSTRRPPELIKLPMPAARHENKLNPAMGTTRASLGLQAEGPTERQERRKRRYATFKHQGGCRNVPVKLP